LRYVLKIKNKNVYSF